jgi:hypothetical protein
MPSPQGQLPFPSPTWRLIHRWGGLTDRLAFGLPAAYCRHPTWKAIGDSASDGAAYHIHTAKSPV